MRSTGRYPRNPSSISAPKSYTAATGIKGSRTNPASLGNERKSLSWIGCNRRLQVESPKSRGRLTQRWSCRRKQRRTQRLVTIRKEIDRVSRKEDDHRRRCKPDDHDQARQENDSANDCKCDRDRIPPQAAASRCQEDGCANRAERQQQDKQNDEDRDGRNRKAGYRENDFHAHIAGKASLFRFDHRPQPAPALAHGEIFESHLRDDEVLDEYVDDRESQHGCQQQQPKDQQAENHYREVFARFSEHAHSYGGHQRDADKNRRRHHESKEE